MQLKMLWLARIIVVLAAMLLGVYSLGKSSHDYKSCSSKSIFLAVERDGSSARAKRYVNFNLLKTYMPNFKDDPFER